LEARLHAATLDHEVLLRVLLSDHPVEDGAVVELVVHVGEEVLDRNGRLFGVEFDLDRPHRRLHDDDWVGGAGHGRPEQIDEQRQQQNPFHDSLSLRQSWDAVGHRGQVTAPAPPMVGDYHLGLSTRIDLMTTSSSGTFWKGFTSPLTVSSLEPV